MDGEDKSLSDQRLLNDHRWRNAEVQLSLGVRKPIKKNQTTPTSPHVVWEVFKKNPPNKLQQIQLPDTTGTSNKKRAFRQQTH